MGVQMRINTEYIQLPVDQLYIDKNDDDTKVTKDSVTLLIDPMSLQYLAGAEIDYQDNVQGSQFVIKNPNATTTCGCGSSFSV